MKVLMDRYAVDPDGITELKTDESRMVNSKSLNSKCFDLSGRAVDANQPGRGIRIMRSADGSYRKVIVP